MIVAEFRWEYGKLIPRAVIRRFARQVADRIVFMDAGQIIEINAPAPFFANPQHERTKLFLSQILH